MRIRYLFCAALIFTAAFSLPAEGLITVPSQERTNAFPDEPAYFLEGLELTILDIGMGQFEFNNLIRKYWYITKLNVFLSLNIRRVAGLKHLRTMDAVRSRLEIVEDCPQLRELDISGTKISSISGFKKMKKLTADFSTLSEIRDCPKLEELSIKKTALREITGFKKLRRLVASHSSLESIGNCPKLELFLAYKCFGFDWQGSNLRRLKAVMLHKDEVEEFRQEYPSFIEVQDKMRGAPPNVVVLAKDGLKKAAESLFTN